MHITPASKNPSPETANRLKALADFLKKNKGDYLATLPLEIFYLANTPIEGIYIYIPRNYPQRYLTVITSPLTQWQVEEEFSRPNCRLKVKILSTDEMISAGLKSLIKENPPNKLYLSSNITCRFKELISVALKKFCSVEETDFVSAGLRPLKSEEEIKIIKENQNFTRHLVENLIPQFIKKNLSARRTITETNIKKFILEYFVKIDAAPAFEPIVAFGKNSSNPHHISTNSSILNPSGDIVLIDTGCRRKNYNSDLTRTFLLGKMKQNAQGIYRTVKDAQKTALSQIRSGISCASIDAAARNLIKDRGYGGCFIHGTGHGLGLEVHELPTLNTKSRQIVQENSVITIEPGIYLKGKFGIRIEDAVVVRKNGYEIL